MKKLTVSELNRISVEEFKETPKLNVIVALDNVRSLYNVGSVFRTADAFRIEKVLLGGITATPQTQPVEIHKTALGAEQSVDWEYCPDLLSDIQRYKENGYTIVSVEQVHDSVMLNDFVPGNDKKYLLVFGNEVKGVQQSIVDNSDIALEIPQSGTKHSLNVSVSAGIVMWVFARSLLYC